MTSKIRNSLIVFSFLLLSITIIGIFWLVTTPGAQAGLIFAYAAGLSMIFLPCTLPLVFVIVPLAINPVRSRARPAVSGTSPEDRGAATSNGVKQSPLKGLTMAILFGLGLAITLSLYGAAVAWVGNYIGMNALIRWMFGIAGAMAFVFGLSELKLLSVHLPFMAKVLPTSLQKSGDYSKSFFMGLFLGNAGVGCPNPAFYVLLTYIATVGSVSDGVLLGIVHGLGRATPLIFLVILAILGINTVNWVSRSQEKVERIMAWGLVGIGAYLFQYLPFKMAFWESSVFHVLWNDIVTRTLPSIAESEKIEGLLNIQGGTATILPWVFIGLMVGAVIIWNAFLQRKKLIQNQTP